MPRGKGKPTKKTPKVVGKANGAGLGNEATLRVDGDKVPARRTLGRSRQDAAFPAAPPRAELPRGYADTLGEIKRRIGEERLRVVLSANAAMVLLCWDIGRVILERQERAGWGAKVIDRLSADLR